MQRSTRVSVSCRYSVLILSKQSIPAMNLRTFSAAFSFLLIGTLWSCTKDDPTPPPLAADTWPQEKLMKMLTSQYWRVQSILRQSSTGTVDLTTDTTFSDNQAISFRKEVLLRFRGDVVIFYPTYALDAGYPDSVETIASSKRIDYYAGASYAWDEAQKTVVFSVNGGGGRLPLPLNKHAIVDKSTIRVYSTIEEAQAAKVHENLTLLSEDIDPVLGKVTYIFNLKPAWQFGSRNDQFSIYYYAIF